MNFQDIRLSFSEMRLLRKSRQLHLPLCKCARLLRLGLVCEVLEAPAPGCMPVGTGIVRISPKGEDYLAFAGSELKRSYLKPMAVSFLTALATTAAANWLWPLLPQVWQSLASVWDQLLGFL